MKNPLQQLGPAAEAAIARYDTLQKIVDSLELSEYENMASTLSTNVAFIALQRMAEKQQE